MVLDLNFVPFGETVFLGNAISAYLYSLAAFFVFLVVFAICQKLVLFYFKKLAKKTKTDIDDTLIRIIQKLRPPFYSFVAFYLALGFLSLSGFLQKLFDAVLVIWVVFIVVSSLQILSEYLAKKYLGKEDEPSTRGAVDLIKRIATGILWVIGALFVLSNLGVNVTSLVAGLGIGGIAIALALQNILDDLFSSFSIYFDKPFVVGDFIIVGQDMGTVKKIGIKTTRLKSLRGEELVIPNKELTNARVQNFKKMEERRVAFNVGVVYETPAEKLKLIPQILEKAISSVKKVRFDRAHFFKYDESALSFEVVYFVRSSNYVTYMDVNQEINFKIKEEFEKKKIEMAYPTRTLYVKK